MINREPLDYLKTLNNKNAYMIYGFSQEGQDEATGNNCILNFKLRTDF